VKPTVLFLCTGNSCRSQMAEGWLRHLAGSQFEVLSAGTKPVRVNPRAVEVMGEVGIDISRHRSKHVAEFQGRHLHYVITICDHAQASCPADPRGDIQLHWSFDDPAYDKVLMLIAGKPFVEYAMILLRRSKGGCERRIRHWNQVPVLCPAVKDRRRQGRGEEHELGLSVPSQCC